MSDEKVKPPKIGGINQQRPQSQYGTIGGGGQRRAPDTEMPERQQSGSLAAPQSGSLARRNAGLSEVQKAKGERVQVTIYIPRELAKWLRVQAALEEREMSEIAAESLEIYRQSRKRDV
jgi:hypothetical protein